MGKHATSAIDRIRELWVPIYNNNNNNSAAATVPRDRRCQKILIFQTAFV